MALPLLQLIPLALKAVAAAGAVPEVVGALAGPKAGEAVERVVGVAQALSGKKDRVAALEAVAGNPELAAQLQAKLIDERLEYARIAAADRADARARDSLFVKAGRWNFRADLMVLGCIVALVFIVNKISGEAVKPEVLAIFNMAVGALLKMLGDAFAFEFGSSRGSKDKDELLKQK